MKYLNCFFLILSCNLLLAQLPDSLSIPTKPMPTPTAIDSSELATKVDSILQSTLVAPKKKNFIRRFFDKKDYPNPKKAVFLSLILPGAGQVYNKQYLKAPIVVGAYTAAIINISRHRRNFRFLRDSRIAELDDDPTTINTTGLDERSLQSLRDNSLTRAETGFLLLLAIHAVQAADAFVFSHLKSFEVSEDLSLEFSPQMGLDPQNRLNAGVQVALSFSAKNKTKPHPF